MKDLPCPNCGELCAQDARVCRHCQAEFTPEQIRERFKMTSGQQIGCGVLIAFLIVGIIFAIGSGTGSNRPTASEAPASPPPDKPAATAKQDAIAFFRLAQSTIEPCDRAGKAVAAAAQSGDPVEVYRQADAMETTCLSVPNEIRKLTPPSSVGKKAFGELTKAIEDCDNAYLAKWSAAGKLKEALENNGSIAAQADLRDAVETLNSATVICAIGLSGPLIELGATSDELGLKD